MQVIDKRNGFGRDDESEKRAWPIDLAILAKKAVIRREERRRLDGNFPKVNKSRWRTLIVRNFGKAPEAGRPRGARWEIDDGNGHCC